MPSQREGPWLGTTLPAVGIISTGNGNDYGHPTADCLERLHAHHVRAYWTESGNGGEPEPGIDAVGGNILVEVAPDAPSFTVTFAGSHMDTFPLTGSVPNPSSRAPAVTRPKYAWSKNSTHYHYANCRFVQNIAPANLEQGDSPPANMTLHKDCPKWGPRTGNRACRRYPGHRDVGGKTRDQHDLCLQHDWLSE